MIPCARVGPCECSQNFIQREVFMLCIKKLFASAFAVFGATALLGQIWATGEMEFVPIRPGVFIMGSFPFEEGRYANERRHQVGLTEAFEMQSTEVTQLQYFAVTGSNPSHFQSKEYCEGQHNMEKGVALCPHHPVENVSWNDIQEFVAQLNQRDDGFIYRLPTEAEWEYAARASTTSAFHWGGSISTDLANYNGHFGLGDDLNTGVFRRQTVAVGSFPANEWGLFDMHGNVWEWVQDTLRPYPRNYVIDPLSITGSFRVLRGGGWANSPRQLRSAARGAYLPEKRSSHMGFRLVRVKNDS